MAQKSGRQRDPAILNLILDLNLVIILNPILNLNLVIISNPILNLNLVIILIPVHLPAAHLPRSKLAEQHHARGYAARKQGRFDVAVEEYSRTLALEPGHFKALFNRGFSYDKVGGRGRGARRGGRKRGVRERRGVGVQVVCVCVRVCVYVWGEER
jgi:tetratricopeptide (TPR) repeat protein